MKTWLIGALGIAAMFPVACKVTVEQEPDNDPKPTARPTPEAKPTAVPTTPPAPEPKMCTKMGCLSSLEIELKAGKVGFAKGNYVIDVEADGKKGKCETKLPLPICLKDGLVKAGLNFRCSGDLGLNMEQAPCAEPKVGPSIGSLKIDGSPKDVKITVTNNKKPYGEVTVAPKYKESRPNGPDCEPLCKQGNAEACVTGKCGE